MLVLSSENAGVQRRRSASGGTVMTTARRLRDIEPDALYDARALTRAEAERTGAVRMPHPGRTPRALEYREGLDAGSPSSTPYDQSEDKL